MAYRFPIFGGKHRLILKCDNSEGGRRDYQMALLCTYFSLQDNTSLFAINLSFSPILVAWNEVKLLASWPHLSTELTKWCSNIEGRMKRVCLSCMHMCKGGKKIGVGVLWKKAKKLIKNISSRSGNTPSLPTASISFLWESAWRCLKSMRNKKELFLLMIVIQGGIIARIHKLFEVYCLLKYKFKRCFLS